MITFVQSINMLFPRIFLRSFRVLLFPLAILYGVGVRVRNWMFDRNMLSSASFGLPMISVGNLAVGGTGKSPFIQYLVEFLGSNEQLAVLSRGYRRRSRGYMLANSGSTVNELGDEAMLLHSKFPDLAVAVGEKRLLAIPQLLQDRPKVSCILLDDAHQHRSVRPGLQILLTEYDNLYTRDYFLPTGDLRDERRSAKRADVVIVTKCPAELSTAQASTLRKELDPLPNQQIFFTTMVLQPPQSWQQDRVEKSPAGQEVLLVTGIANPIPLKKWMERDTASYQFLPFSDHHLFNIDDIREIRNQFRRLNNPDAWILTTSKDAVRLLPYTQEMQDLPVFVTDYRHRFLFDEEPLFQAFIQKYLARSRAN